MAIIRGWRLIRQTSNGVFYFNCTTGQVEYSPRRRYRIEKKNAFDPTILHQRDEYREDSFDLQATLNPDEYYTLMNFITASGRLYLEYTAYNEVRSQFPVTVSQFPKCPDDLHEYTEKVKFSLESRYIGSPGYIDFGIIIIEDDSDNITSS
ncbi:MAG: hypothetical protein Q8M98_02945 [Candidatus Cloacimonadaceae bacterium]|nr:hypothetical protein [Candidatus Cloacimonadaceae bacterium]